MCPSMAEEFAILSLGDGRSYTREQRQRSKLRMKARPSELSIGDGGSIGLVRRQWLRTKAAEGAEVSQGSKIGFMGLGWGHAREGRRGRGVD
ncbi:hypothetical protein BHE74_00052934 [Ensete ventricosum]|nr:hypothetical protein BHE74_00052934 [Ensete ventricosum]